MADRLSQLQSMLDADPADAFCSYALAMEFAKLGRHNEAVEWFDRTLQIEPTQCYAYYHKAKTLEVAGETQAAIGVVRAGLAKARSINDAKAAGELAALLDEMDDQ